MFKPRGFIGFPSVFIQEDELVIMMRTVKNMPQAWESAKPKMSNKNKPIVMSGSAGHVSKLKKK